MSFENATDASGVALTTNAIPGSITIFKGNTIAITTPPTKTVYYEDETFNPAGMVVTYYDNEGVSSNVTSACTFTPSITTPLTPENTEITVTYTPSGGTTLTATQTITVNPKLVTGISAAPSGAPKQYYAFEMIEAADIIVTATYNDGNTAPVSTYSIEYGAGESPARDPQSLRAGDISVDIEYTGTDAVDPDVPPSCELNFKAVAKATPTVNPVLVSSATIYTDAASLPELTLTSGDTPGTVELVAGQPLVAGTTNYNWTFEPDDTANYSDKTGTIPITVVESTLSSFTLDARSVTIDYYAKEDFDLTGLVITETYTSGEEKVIDSGYTGYEVLCGGEERTVLKAGDTFVDILKTGTELTQRITGITVEKLTPAIGTVAVKFEDGQTAVYSDYYNVALDSATGLPELVYTKADGGPDGTAQMFSATTPLPIGEDEYFWTFTPNDTDYGVVKNNKITINVIEAVVESIAIDKLPTKTEYDAFETFDPTGLVVEETYNSGNVKDAANGYDGYGVWIGKVSTEPTRTKLEVGDTVKVVKSDNANISVDITNAITINKVLPVVTVDVYDTTKVYTSSGVSDLPALTVTKITVNGTDVPAGNISSFGTIAWDNTQPAHTTEGKYDFTWTFTPADDVNYEIVTGTEKLDVHKVVYESITVTYYTQGDDKFYTNDDVTTTEFKGYFNNTLEIEGTMSDGTTKDVALSTCDISLPQGDNNLIDSIVISFGEGDERVSTTLALNVTTYVAPSAALGADSAVEVLHAPGEDSSDTIDITTSAGTSRAAAAGNVTFSADQFSFTSETSIPVAGLTVTDIGSTAPGATKLTITIGEEAHVGVQSVDLYFKYEGEAVVTVTGGPVTIKNDEAEAAIGDTPYETFLDALAAVTDNTPTTIKLLKDVTVNTAIDIASGRNITINLNSKKLTTTVDSAAITINGTLTLKGPGSLILNVGAYLKCMSKNTLIIDGVSVSTIVNNNGTTEILSAEGPINIVMQGDDKVVVNDDVKGVKFVGNDLTTEVEPPAEIDGPNSTTYYNVPNTALTQAGTNDTVVLNDTATGNINIPANRTVDVSNVSSTNPPALTTTGSDVNLITSSQSGFDAAAATTGSGTPTITITGSGTIDATTTTTGNTIVVGPDATLDVGNNAGLTGEVDVDGTIKGTPPASIKYLIEGKKIGNGDIELYEADASGAKTGSNLWPAGGGKYYAAKDVEYVVVATPTSPSTLGGINGKYADGTSLTIENEKAFTQDQTAGLVITATFNAPYSPPPAGGPVTGVTLNPKKLTVSIGGTGTIAAIIAPENATDKSVSWASSDEKVATVAGGVVTGVAEGTATITVTTTDGGFTDTCEVTVVAGPPPVIDGNPLDYNIRSMAKGKKIALPPVPGYTGTWSIKDTSIADFAKDGKVKGLELGITKLVYTVTAVGDATFKLNDEPLEPGKSYELIELRVRKAGELAKSIAVKPKNVTLFINEDKAVALTPTVKPAKKTLDKEVFWKSNKPGVVKVSPEGVITAVSVGKAKITAMTTTLKKFTVNVTVTKPTTTVTIMNENGAIIKKATIAKDATMALKAVVAGLEQTGVTWTSKNPKIASVSADGLVTGLKKGEAKIVAKANDGSDAKASVTITVTKN